MALASNKYTKELELTLKAISSHVDPEAAIQLQRYIGTTQKVHGLSSKAQQELSKKGFSFHRTDAAETFRVYDHIYRHSDVFEARNLAFIFLDRHYKHIPLSLQLELLPAWVQHVDNWAHSDSLSKFLSRLTEQPDTRSQMLAHLRRWNLSKNPWERRQSLVALFYYARTRKYYLPFDEVIALVNPLIHDPEYFVQKAVGWTLRESYNAYPRETYRFLEQHMAVLSPYAFTASTEKMPAKEKAALKALRQPAKNSVSDKIRKGGRNARS